MSKNKQDLGPYRRKQFQTYFQFSLIAICFVIIFVLFYACTGSSKNDIDYTDAKVIQMDEPADDSPVVVFETNKGTFKAVLFPDEAPNYCKFFTGLVEKGYYDGTYVSMVQDGVYFIGGTKQTDGQTTSDTDTTTIEAEYSKNLWPLKGALCAYTQEQGHLFSKKKVSNSYLLFVDNYDLTEEEQAELDSKLADSNNIPEDITDAFEKYGGVLNFSQQYTVFGQVYDGLDIYDEICWYCRCGCPDQGFCLYEGHRPHFRKHTRYLRVKLRAAVIQKLPSDIFLGGHQIFLLRKKRKSRGSTRAWRRRSKPKSRR